MTAEIKKLNVDGIIFDSATRRGKIIGLKLWIPTVAWSAMYPPLYQYNRTHTIKKQLLRDAFNAPRAFIKIWQAITKLIFEHKPVDYDELYTRLYNDNDIGTHTAIPLCMMEPNEVTWLYTYQHHGICLDEHSEDDSAWTWLRDEKRSIIYLSLGTLISVDGKMLETLESISGTQLLFVVSTWPHGTNGRSDGVVWQSFVPQKQILDYATLCITHGGINTVIECLARKLPMLCVPFLTDQHMYSHRVEQLWVGRVESKSVLKSRDRLQQVLSDMLINQEFTKNYKEVHLYEWIQEYNDLVGWFEKQTL
jgi:UDP:flavonoid glycosyltransferase YjiC (YdhE family)